MAAPQVAFIRPEIVAMTPKYDLVDHCVNQLVKLKGDLYLPRPSAEDTSAENIARYDGYLTRAIFYQVTSRTLGGLVGQIFANDPEVKVPAALKALEKDANGDGLSLIQSSKDATRQVIAYGRVGLYIDYPIINEGEAVTKLQQDSGEIKPTFNLYGPKNVINWGYIRKGAKHIYSLIVLVEWDTINLDDFATEKRIKYKALRLKRNELTQKNEYYIEIYRPDANSLLPEVPETLYPRDANGKPLEEIPFTFIGAENNDADPDGAPLFPMAELNVGHYRNSADFEEACFIVGQPTYVVTGLTEVWYKNILKEKLNVGSRGGIPLPVGADAKILQVEPNSMAMEAMAHKEAQMVAIGAQLVEQKSVQQTATEANISNKAETSALADIAKNVSAAYKFGLEIAMLFQGTAGEVEFALNTDFAINRLSAQDRTQLIAEWQSGAVTFTEMRRALRDSGVAFQSDEEAQKELDAVTERKAVEAADAAKKLADAVPPVKPGAVPA